MGYNVKEATAIRSIIKQTTDSVTRPTTSATYTVNYALNSLSAAATAVLTFQSASDTAGEFINIVGASVTCTRAATTLPEIDLWLFNTIPTAINDNAAMTLTDTENDNVVAVIPFNTWKYTALNSRCDRDSISIPVKLAAADTQLYGIPVVKNLYAASASETFKFTLNIERQ